MVSWNGATEADYGKYRMPTNKNELQTALGLMNNGFAVTNPKGLRRWHSAFSAARFSPVNIVVLGDSISAGVGSDGTPNTSDDSICRTRGWVNQLRLLFADSFGDTGLGWISYPDNGGRVTGTAGFGGVYGVRNQGFKVTNTVSTTLTITDPFTEIDIWSWDGGSGNYTVTIDGGAGNIFSGGGGDTNVTTWTKQTITGLSDAGHTVVITGPASGTCYFAGAVVRRKTTGVFVHRMAKPGDTSNNLLAKDSLSYANTGAQNRSLLGLGKTPLTDIVIIAIGTNDHGAQATTDITANLQPGTIPDTYEANIRALANQAVVAGASVLLLAEGRRPNPSGTYSEQEYWDRMKKIAQDTDHVSFIDINDVWGSNTLGNQLGYYTASSVHPTLKGHGSMARIVFNALTRPFGFNSPDL